MHIVRTLRNARTTVMYSTLCSACSSIEDMKPTCGPCWDRVAEDCLRQSLAINQAISGLIELPIAEHVTKRPHERDRRKTNVRHSCTLQTPKITLLVQLSHAADTRRGEAVGDERRPCRPRGLSKAVFMPISRGRLSRRPRDVCTGLSATSRIGAGVITPRKLSRLWADICMYRGRGRRSPVTTR